MHFFGNRCKTNQTAGLWFGEYVFKEVNDFKYQSANMNNKNDDYK